MSLRVIGIQAENFKRLKAIDITPTGDVVFVGGRNAQGKTSVLDAIWAALAGREAAAAIKQPIRDGEERATVRLDLGEYVVTRKWSKNDSGTLTVTAADGAKYSSPQKILDEVIGARAFDPLAFTRLSAKDQVAALTKVVELPFDPAELERKRAGVFDERTDAKRTLAQFQAQLNSLPKPTPGTPTEDVSVDEIVAELEAANRANRNREEIDREHQQWVDKQESLATRIDTLEAEIVQAKADFDQVVLHRQQAWGDVVDAGDPIDTDEITARLTLVGETNKARAAAREYERVARLVHGGEQAVAVLNENLVKIERTKKDALAAVKFPVDGLSFDETGVTYKGVTFAQASAAEQLRVSVALAMAANPRLRVLRILDGSLLDSDSLALIAELARENDYQVWVEIVDETGTVGVTIEDGEVVL